MSQHRSSLWTGVRAGIVPSQSGLDFGKAQTGWGLKPCGIGHSFDIRTSRHQHNEPFADDNTPMNVPTQIQFVDERGQGGDCPRDLVLTLETPRRGGVLRHCLPIVGHSFHIRTSRYQENVSFGMTMRPRECP